VAGLSEDEIRRERQREESTPKTLTFDVLDQHGCSLDGC
jgi:hypothetical protein